LAPRINVLGKECVIGARHSFYPRGRRWNSLPGGQNDEHRISVSW
jgi:hypothetical protein